MGILKKLFKKEILANLSLNAAFMPVDRGAYEDLTDRHLRKNGWGSLAEGGGTLLSPEGKPIACDFDIRIKPDKLEDVRRWLDGAFFVPKGSKLILEAGEHPVGQQEGVAVLLARSEIDAPGMTGDMVNAGVQALEEAVGDAGMMLSVHQDGAGASLYFYGQDGRALQAALEGAFAKHPLFQKAKTVPLA